MDCHEFESQEFRPFRLGHVFITGIRIPPAHPRGGFGHLFTLLAAHAGFPGSFEVRGGLVFRPGLKFDIESDPTHDGEYTIIAQAIIPATGNVLINVAEPVVAGAPAGRLRYGGEFGGALMHVNYGAS